MSTPYSSTRYHLDLARRTAKLDATVLDAPIVLHRVPYIALERGGVVEVLASDDIRAQLDAPAQPWMCPAIRWGQLAAKLALAGDIDGARNAATTAGYHAIEQLGGTD